MKYGYGYGYGVNLQQGKRYEPETKTLFTVLTGSYPELRKRAINQLIKSLKTSGLWSKIDVLQVYAALNVTDAVINWKNPGVNNAILVNSPVLEADRGITGDGASSYIRSGFIPSANGVNFTLNSAGFHIGIRNNLDMSGTDLGVTDGTNLVRFLSRYSSSSSLYNVNQTSNTTAGSITTSAGFFSVCRTAVDSLYRRRNKASTGTETTASSSLPNKEVYIGAYNNNGSPNNYTNRQYSFAALSSGFSAIESDLFADVLEIYLDFIGAGLI